MNSQISTSEQLQIVEKIVLDGEMDPTRLSYYEALSAAQIANQNGFYDAAAFIQNKIASMSRKESISLAW